jgi:hypothetical protein
MNDSKNSVPVNQEQSAVWIAARVLLSVPTLGVVCVAFLSAIMAAVNMTEVCPDGMSVGHIPCDVSILFGLISLLIAGLGILLLRLLGRMGAVWNRLQPDLARNARVWRERLNRWGWPERIESLRRWRPFARKQDP